MDLTNALWITLIGMGLVFIAILLLWGLMVLLVRLTAEREPAETELVETAAESSTVTGLEAAQEADQLLNRKRKAAAAAVAAAMAFTSATNGRKSAAAAREPQSAGALSAWQAVNRARQISQRASSRKKVV